MVNHYFHIIIIIADSRDYAVPDVTKSALVVALPPIYPPQPPLRGQSSLTGAVDIPPPTYDALYAAADVINAQGLNIPSLQVCIQVFVHSCDPLTFSVLQTLRIYSNLTQKKMLQSSEIYLYG